MAGANSTFSGGTVTNTGTLRGLGRVNNVVANSGTIRAENGTLTLAAAGHTNAAAGRIEAGAGTQVLYSQGLATNAGQIALTGGAFDNNNVALANPGLHRRLRHAPHRRTSRTPASSASAARSMCSAPSRKTPPSARKPAPPFAFSGP